MNGVGSRSFVEPGRCAASGCTKLRINIKCTRRACATHCRAMGGCSVNLHQPAGTMSMPSRSQSFETAYMLSRSQPPLASCSPSTPAITLLHNSPPLPPLSFSPTQIPGPSSNEARQPPSSVQFSQAPPLPAASSRMPAQIIAEPPSSMNPLPDPRFASQMRPIFTTQALREQEMREDARTMDEQRLNGAKKVKHTVTLCAWLSVCLQVYFVFAVIDLFYLRTTMGLRNRFIRAGLSGLTSACHPRFSLMPAFQHQMKTLGTICTIDHAGHGNGSRLTISSLWILQQRSSSRPST